MWLSAGSGKSTIAAQIAESTKAKIVSSDSIRGEVYGDENCQADPAKIFEIVHQRVHQYLKNGENVIMDATNLSCKRRMSFLKTLAHIECEKDCVVVVATPEDIWDRMQYRDRKVPKEVIHRQITQFQCPNYYEGWDFIEVKWTSTNEDCFKSLRTLWRECEMPHDNSHHSLTIDAHMIEASLQANQIGSPFDSWVAHLHDIGKPRVKSFIDRDGNVTKEAHYYGHWNYSAYYFLIQGYIEPTKMLLDDACLIQWHMEHFFRRGEALTKFHEMIGPELTARLQILEEADMKAH